VIGEPTDLATDPDKFNDLGFDPACLLIGQRNAIGCSTLWLAANTEVR
jgi:hypothetical protein